MYSRISELAYTGLRHCGAYLLPLLVLSLASCFFVYFSMVAYHGKGIFDFPIFLDAARGFIESGELYSREDDFSSGLAIYKFPPLFAAILVQGFRLGVSYYSFFEIAYALHIILFVVSVVLLSINAKRLTGDRRWFFYVMSVGLFFFPLLDNNILILQVDVYLFFLIACCFFCLSAGRYFLCGLLIAIAAALKIYPIVLMVFFLVYRLSGAFLGFFLGLLLTAFFAVFALSFSEFSWFFYKIFPILISELPMGGGANNVSLPTFVSQILVNEYLVSVAGSVEYQDIKSKIESGLLSQAALESDVLLIRHSVKVFSLICLVVVVAAGECARRYCAKSASRQLSMQLLFCALVAYMVAFMQNSWTNYQIHLLIPILFLLQVFAVIPKASERFLCGFSYGLVLFFWVWAFLDAAQERVNQVLPDYVPLFLKSVTDVIPGLTGLTSTGRCLAAAVLIVICSTLSLKICRYSSMPQLADIGSGSGSENKP